MISMNIFINETFSNFLRPIYFSLKYRFLVVQFNFSKLFYQYNLADECFLNFSFLF